MGVMVFCGVCWRRKAGGNEGIYMRLAVRGMDGVLSWWLSRSMWGRGVASEGGGKLGSSGGVYVVAGRIGSGGVGAMCVGWLRVGIVASIMV